ncbi:MAG: polysaccharide deacetylase family protein [Nanoarchaeota archaeon]|nr:polysaccharide deacetylase family protein [Nanoarchaeota archaeon]
MKSINISIDVEPDLYGGKFEGITKGLDKFIGILNKYNIKATLFVTAEILDKYPKIFQNLKKQGYEIGLHGYKHERFDELDLKEKKELLKKSVKIYKNVLKENPKGFRAPQHSIDNETLTLLEDYNFKYDSSTIPWNFHHIFLPQIKIKFDYNFKKMKIHKMNNLYEIPITSFILPFSALTIRFLPFFIFKIYIRFVNLFKNKIFFMHSWDFIKLKKSRLYNRCPLKEFLKRFDYMLNYFNKNNEFKTIESMCLYD